MLKITEDLDSKKIELKGMIETNKIYADNVLTQSLNFFPHIFFFEIDKAGNVWRFFNFQHLCNECRFGGI